MVELVESSLHHGGNLTVNHQRGVVFAIAEPREVSIYMTRPWLVTLMTPLHCVYYRIFLNQKVSDLHMLLLRY